MGWSVGYRGPPEAPVLDRYLLAVGKALYVATEFDGKCRYVRRMGRLVRYVESEQKLDYLGFLEFASKFKDPQLGPTIDAIDALAALKSEHRETLMKGKAARNYIAHEALGLGPLYAVRVQDVHERVETLRGHVSALLAADNLVSRWVYEIDEKEDARGMLESYEAVMASWIFEPIDDDPTLEAGEKGIAK